MDIAEAIRALGNSGRLSVKAVTDFLQTALEFNKAQAPAARPTVGEILGQEDLDIPDSASGRLFVAYNMRLISREAFITSNDALYDAAQGRRTVVQDEASESSSEVGIAPATIAEHKPESRVS